MTGPARRGNLPGDLTSFVGRRSELATVKRLFSEARLVTLTGFGGVGKTRLALHVGVELERNFRDGVWLVDLTPLRDPGLVAPTVAAALGLRDESGRWSLAVLTEYLAERHVLLLIDNCEHLLDASAVLVETLLRGASELRILASSRQMLGVPGERVFTVPPLPVPSADRGLRPVESMAQYDGVVLLVERARAGAPHFALTEDNVEAVARLAQRLDGIPLALELAAARLRMLSPQQVLDRLDDRFRLLTSGARTARPHQESLQALIDWSFDLCSTEERLLWARLAVFPRDFDVDAVEAICSGDGIAAEAVLDALTGLVDKSIAAAEGDASRMRYRLPETLREYGRGRLDALEQEAALRRRYQDYYRRLGDRAYAEWFGPRQVEFTRLAQVEYVNLRAALEFYLAEPDRADEGLAIFRVLYLSWTISGSLGEGRRLLDRALAVATEPSAGRAIALWIAAWTHLNQGDVAAAEAAGTEARLLAQRHGDRSTLGNTLAFLGLVRVEGGDLAGAEALFREALDSVGPDAPRVSALALHGLANIAEVRRDVAAATALLEDCVAICEAHGESWIRGYALANWAVLALEQRDTARATDLARESLRIRSGFGHRVGMAVCLDLLAWIAASESAYDRAAWLLGAAEALRNAVGASLFPHLAPFHDRCEVATRRALGERAFRRAFEQGAREKLADAVAYALAEKAPVAPQPPDQAELTRREREIAELVAQGMTNREIAAKFVISERTAEGHVQNMLRKLSFTSRAQIAAWVAERRADAR